MSNWLQTSQPEMKPENFLAEEDILSELKGSRVKAGGTEGVGAEAWDPGRVSVLIISRRPLPDAGCVACRAQP